MSASTLHLKGIIVELELGCESGDQRFTSDVDVHGHSLFLPASRRATEFADKDDGEEALETLTDGHVQGDSLASLTPLSLACCASISGSESSSSRWSLCSKGGDVCIPLTGHWHDDRGFADTLLANLNSNRTLLDLDLQPNNNTDRDVHVYELRMHVLGGIDFQNRVGSKIGSGGQLSESQAAVERKERLRKLALETIDISKDPYFMRNHLGSYECKLCLTLHTTEGNYLAHTQGKRHQSNLGRRAAMEAKNATVTTTMVAKELPARKIIKIGRPGYNVTKSRDIHTKQRCLTFEIDYPEVSTGTQPRHRFMSAYEQKVETPDKNYQYLLFACEPYETVAFKIPNVAIDKREGRFFTNWSASENKFVLQLYFVEELATVQSF